MYLVGSSFAHLVLRLYVGGRWGRFSLRATIFGHQVILLSLSLYSLTVMKHSNVRLWHGFRIGVIGYCVVSEVWILVGKIGLVNGKGSCEDRQPIQSQI